MSKPDRATVALIARFVALPGHRPDVWDLISAYALHVRSATGCDLFLPTTATDNPHEFVVLEQYRDPAAFADHIADPENATFNSALAPHIGGVPRLEMLKVID